jgi:hypothetical protein
VIQYHDPQLCSFLDSKKIQPQQYASDWFNSLLSSSLTRPICQALWDHYFQRGDPFIVFFIALSFLQCTREQILKLEDKRAIIDLIKSAPANMAEDDLGDLFEVCVVTMNCTPDSLRQDFHCMLFGANLVDEITDFPLNTIICLPISVQELFKRVIDLSSPKLGQVCFEKLINLISFIGLQLFHYRRANSHRLHGRKHLWSVQSQWKAG